MNETPGAAEADVSGPLAQLHSVLIAGETLEAWVIQRRVYALTHRRVLIAATSGRLIVLTRRLLGGFEVTSIRWQDLEEVTLRVGMLAAELYVRAGKATDLASMGAAGAQRVEFQGLRKSQAQAVYRICFAQDQAAREKRRVRELEELRARSGGIQSLCPRRRRPPWPDLRVTTGRLQEAKQFYRRCSSLTPNTRRSRRGLWRPQFNGLSTGNPQVIHTASALGWRHGYPHGNASAPTQARRQ